MSRPLVGLVGKKRAGKDTVAAQLVAEFGFVRYAFADPLKAVALDTDPWVPYFDRYARLSEVQAWRGSEGAKTLPEVRRYWQDLGVAMREHVDPDVWLNATMRKVVQEARPVVVTDVRFPNEADAIESAGGVLVRIHRSSLTDADSHVSETALVDRLCAFHIYNDGGLPELEAAATDLAGRVLGWWQ